MQIGAHDVAEGRDGKLQPVEFELFSFFLGCFGPTRVAFGVFGFVEEVKDEGQDFSQEHGCDLHEGVEEVFLDPSLVHDLLVLRFVD